MKDKIIVCPACRSSLQHDKSKLVCTSCNISYPLLTAEVPIIMPDPDVFITNAYLQYEKVLSDRNTDLQKLKTATGGGYDRSSEVVDKLELAYQTNDRILLEIIKSLKHLVSADHIKDAYLKDKAGPQSYMFNFSYLIRDWGSVPNGESEIQTITEHVIKALEKHPIAQEDSSILFLGAGMGRIAYEVSGHLEKKVYAIDNSITMAYLFDKISREDLCFFEVNLKNVENVGDLVVEHLASTRGSLKKIRNYKPDVQYLVGDAARLPFPDNSLSSVVSVYFTDVIPLPLLIKEVKRVLKNDGIFIHFGPLEYHHDDIRFMFSLEETKRMFSGQHFKVQDHLTLTTPHCQVLSSGMYKTYQTWLFTAQKTTPYKIIHDSTKIFIVRDIDYFQSGTLGANIFNLNSSLVLGVNDVYEGAETVLDIIKIIKTGKTFEVMIKELQIEYGEIGPQEQEHIKRILLDLANRGVLSLEEP